MKIFISNLGHQVTEDSLAIVFGTFGRVNQSRFLIQGPAHSRIALIEMPDENEASLAISRLNGSFINGTVIRAHMLGEDN